MRAIPGSLTVGVGVRSYNSAYGYAGLDVPGVRFRPALRIPFNRVAPGSLTALDTYVPLDPGVRLVHVMNGVVATGMPAPWVTSFESMLPRLDGRHHGTRLDRWLVGRLLGSRCRRLLAFSDYALGWLSEQHPPAVADRLLAKAEVFTGSTGPPVSQPQRHSLPLEVVFIGGELLRKGGVAVLRAARALAEDDVPVRLTVVGSPEDTTDVVPPADRYRAEFEALLPFVEHVPRLSQAEVHDLVARSHVLVYPSLQETLGWAALEAMQRAVVPIVSGIAPLRGLVGSGGIVLDVPLDRLGSWEGLSLPVAARAAAAEETLRLLTDGVVSSLRRLAAEPAEYQRLSVAALGEYSRRFDPVDSGLRLRVIYDRALEG